MVNPLADPYLVLSKVYREGAYLKHALAGVPLEPEGRARTVKICYGVIEKDIFLEAVVAANAGRTPRSSVKLILKIALYMLEFMGKHGYMVIDCAVELVKKAGKGGAAGFVNAFLRSYKLPPPPQTEYGRLSSEYGAPVWLVRKLKRRYKGQTEAILAAKSRGLCVRFVRGAERYLSRPHIDTPFEGVYIFPEFVRDGGFAAGDYTFQSVGSAAICAAVEGGERLLDACAAPGGKSVTLSHKFGSVLARDIHPHRVRLIGEYAARMGAENIRAEVYDSSVYDPSLCGAFDAVLVDAPCSGTGVINENPDIMLRRMESDVQSLARTQLAILSACAGYVKEGGALYYSTCSVLPEENDSVAYSFMREHPEFTLKIPSSPLAHEKTPFGLQFLPHISLGAGFFLTSFIKNRTDV